MLSHFENVGIPRRCKSEVCKEIKADLVVEDAPHNAEVISQIGIPVILLTKPWNKNFDESKHPLVTRCEGWVQACHHITSEFNSEVDTSGF